MSVQPLRKTATGQMHGAARGGILHSVVIKGGSADTDCTIYDNATAASGVVLVEVSILLKTTLVLTFDDGMPYKDGLWCVLAGAGGSAIAYTE